MQQDTPNIDNMRPCGFGQGRNGLPAIQWWRNGVAAAGERSIVTAVTEYPDIEARDRAYFEAVERRNAPPQSVTSEVGATASY